MHVYTDTDTKKKHKTELNGLHMAGWQALIHPEVQEIQKPGFQLGFLSKRQCLKTIYVVKC
jgi:hypothetical protein